MENRQWFVGILLILSITITPLAYAIGGAVGATLTIGNSPPKLPLVVCNKNTNITLLDGAIKSVYCIFNVTDSNGINNIAMDGVIGYAQNESASKIINTTCISALNDTGTNTAQFNCTFPFPYYSNSGNWQFFLNTSDLAGANATNGTINLTVNSLTAMTLVSTNISFGTVTPGTNDNAAIDDPIILNNTGNFAFTVVNISANNLTGETTGTEHIWAGNFSANDADAATGEALAEENAAQVTIVDIAIPFGLPAISKDLIYVYLDLSTGYSVQNFSTQQSGRNWNIISV
jgi:hypothetical protein